jgi:hypothetical protein
MPATSRRGMPNSRIFFMNISRWRAYKITDVDDTRKVTKKKPHVRRPGLFYGVPGALTRRAN